MTTAKEASSSLYFPFNPSTANVCIMNEIGPHCKKELAIFPSLAGMSLTKLSLGGKKLNYSRPGRV
jgi:hypothetical protein